MCGIVGMFRLQAGRPVDAALVAAMNQAQYHRGPDEGDQYIDEQIGLGHRRLSIIDLASGQQPMTDESGRYVLIFNGEIYNFMALRAELEALGHVFKTHCDTEVILRGHMQWGDACVERLQGMFAYAFWDKAAQRLLLARDRLGIKPLFYTLFDQTLYFASELKSLKLIPGLDKTINPIAIEQYFTLGYVAEPATIYQSVQKLCPAQTLALSVSAATPKLHTYWHLSYKTQIELSDADYQQQLVAELNQAIASHLVTEVPLGSFLSGGVDSSAVVALIAGMSDQPVKTCSIGFDVAAYDETSYAQHIAERYHTQHDSKIVKSDDFSLIPQLAHFYDEPYADSSALATYRVCELARSKVTVCMSGDGADELLAGYRRYKMLMAEQQVRNKLPEALRKAIFKPLGKLYPKLDWAPRFLRAKTTFQALAMDQVEGYLHAVSLLKQEQRDQLFSPQLKQQLAGYNTLQLFREVAADFDGHDELALLQYIDIRTYLVGDILTKVDRASMANSLEVRVPFLDHKFVEWTAKIPAQQKLRAGEGKYVLKKAMEPYLPADILYRPKMGFRVPLAEWFRGALQQQLRQALLSDLMRNCGWFQMDTIERWLDQHQSGQRDHSTALWTLLMFENFLRQSQ
ncbi:XrtA/PEP-CTERM system amidotransferase [Rheinheimera sp. F8]|uniref:XrtA/PEP-CTERM system amidotransferase n=1 Tax=Rheinheimera sp. F8 TaxID=1763998 RepID=UPI000744A843|nr:XrtA/PEP-CTERM system amidotransferase [Rheinheimera sp. F8]ALZ74993.1 asparagine synthetase B [Rheinheimera sp. F8]ALZ76581.1 asparagine synthetase B [Rheinheimera sp. F8]